MSLLSESGGRVVSAREVALKALRDVDEKGVFAGQALDSALSRHPLAPRDRALATELVYGVARRRGTLDWALGQVSRRPLDQMTVWTRNVLRAGAYQLMYLDRIPASAVTHEAVELAKKYGHQGVAGFVNGVLRSLIRALPLRMPDPAAEPVAGLSLRHSMPEWLVERWLGQYGAAETGALLEAMAGHALPTLRVNRTRLDRAELLRRLEKEGAVARPTRWSPDGATLESGVPVGRLQALQRGWCTVQDESSMLVAPVVDPQPGMTVLDLAAAPGGKSTHLAELMRDEGRVLAVDAHPDKMETIEENAARLGLEAVESVCADARHVGRLFAGRADAVLCDLPCSGLGTLARRPDARWRKQPEDIAGLAALQQEILAAAAVALKPGGVLVYSTCTIAPEENEDTVAAFLAAHPDFAAEDLRPYLPEELRPEAAADGSQIQLLPHRHGTDGFFIARMRRVR